MLWFVSGKKLSGGQWWHVWSVSAGMPNEWVWEGGFLWYDDTFEQWYDHEDTLQNPDELSRPTLLATLGIVRPDYAWGPGQDEQVSDASCEASLSTIQYANDAEDVTDEQPTGFSADAYLIEV